MTRVCFTDFSLASPTEARRLPPDPILVSRRKPLRGQLLNEHWQKSATLRVANSSSRVRACEKGPDILSVGNSHFTPNINCLLKCLFNPDAAAGNGCDRPGRNL